MKIDLNELLESGKKDKNILILLKNVAVKSLNYELASQLREMETTLFPPTKEEKTAKAIVNDHRLLFQLLGMQASERGIYSIVEGMKAFGKMKGKFDLETASKIRAKADEIFGIE